MPMEIVGWWPCVLQCVHGEGLACTYHERAQFHWATSNVPRDTVLARVDSDLHLFWREMQQFWPQNSLVPAHTKSRGPGSRELSRLPTLAVPQC